MPNQVVIEGGRYTGVHMWHNIINMLARLFHEKGKMRRAGTKCVKNSILLTECISSFYNIIIERERPREEIAYPQRCERFSRVASLESLAAAQKEFWIPENPTLLWQRGIAGDTGKRMADVCRLSVVVWCLAGRQVVRKSGIVSRIF